MESKKPSSRISPRTLRSVTEEIARDLDLASTGQIRASQNSISAELEQLSDASLIPGTRPPGRVFYGERIHRIYNAYGEPLPARVRYSEDIPYPEDKWMQFVVDYIAEIERQTPSKQMAQVLVHNLDVNSRSERILLRRINTQMLGYIDLEASDDTIGELRYWYGLKFSTAHPEEETIDSFRYVALQSKSISERVFGPRGQPTPERNTGYREAGLPKFVALDYLNPFFHPASNYAFQLDERVQRNAVYTRFNVETVYNFCRDQLIGENPADQDAIALASHLDLFIRANYEPDCVQYHVWLEAHTDVTPEEFKSADYVPHRVQLLLDEIATRHSKVVLLGAIMCRDDNVICTNPQVPDIDTLRMHSWLSTPCPLYGSRTKRPVQEREMTEAFRLQVRNTEICDPRPSVLNTVQILREGIYPLKLATKWEEPQWTRSTSSRYAWRESVIELLTSFADYYGVNANWLMLFSPFYSESLLDNASSPQNVPLGNVVTESVITRVANINDDYDHLDPLNETGLSIAALVYKAVKTQVERYELKGISQRQVREMALDYFDKLDRIVQPTSPERKMGVDQPSLIASPITREAVIRLMHERKLSAIPEPYLNPPPSSRYNRLTERSLQDMAQLSLNSAAASSFQPEAVVTHAIVANTVPSYFLQNNLKRPMLPHFPYPLDQSTPEMRELAALSERATVHDLTAEQANRRNQLIPIVGQQIGAQKRHVEYLQGVLQAPVTKPFSPERSKRPTVSTMFDEPALHSELANVIRRETTGSAPRKQPRLPDADATTPEAKRVLDFDASTSASVVAVNPASMQSSSAVSATSVFSATSAPAFSRRPSSLSSVSSSSAAAVTDAPSAPVSSIEERRRLAISREESKALNQPRPSDSQILDLREQRRELRRTRLIGNRAPAPQEAEELRAAAYSVTMTELARITDDPTSLPTQLSFLRETDQTRGVNVGIANPNEVLAGVPFKNRRDNIQPLSSRPDDMVFFGPPPPPSVIYAKGPRSATDIPPLPSELLPRSQRAPISLARQISLRDIELAQRRQERFAADVKRIGNDPYSINAPEDNPAAMYYALRGAMYEEELQRRRAELERRQAAESKIDVSAIDREIDERVHPPEEEPEPWDE